MRSKESRPFRALRQCVDKPGIAVSGESVVDAIDLSQRDAQADGSLIGRAFFVAISQAVSLTFLLGSYIKSRDVEIRLEPVHCLIYLGTTTR